MTTEVRAAVRGDVAAMQAIGVAAGELFRGVDDPRIAHCADDPPMEEEVLAGAIDAGSAWVAVEGGEVVGYMMGTTLDGHGYLEEMAVLPTSGRRGVGSALLEAAVAWSVACGHPFVTLLTFRDVPWNAPFYARRSFRELPEPDWPPGLRAVVEEEMSFDLDPSLRVVMVRDAPAAGQDRVR
jgi:GNAT superfamily N-acetyltransferase